MVMSNSLPFRGEVWYRNSGLSLTISALLLADSEDLLKCLKRGVSLRLSCLADRIEMLVIVGLINFLWSEYRVVNNNCFSTSN